MALFNITVNADLKRLAAAADRIAHSLERICTHWCGVLLSDPPLPAEPKRLDEELTYTSNDDELRRELERELRSARGESDAIAADDAADADGDNE